MYDLVTQISTEYNHPIIEITESGCGYLDGPNEEEHGRIPDGRRIQWYREVLAELARAIADGARVRAFHAWTLLDNFQWTEGYTERYGLIYTDFRNQSGTIKIRDFGTVELLPPIGSMCEAGGRRTSQPHGLVPPNISLSLYSWFVQTFPWDYFTLARYPG